MKSIQRHLEANGLYYLLGLLMYMPIFGHLNSLPLRYWDELRLAVSAWEMLEHGQYLVPHYFGKPDLWNTKPPMTVWTQVFFMKTIGVNEIAVRLPSAIAAFLTCVALLVFIKRYLKSQIFGIITVLVLITSLGYISEHGTRTGDYDAMLCLFSGLGLLFMFSFFESNRLLFYYLGFLAFAAAVLTKGIAGLFFGPAILLYALFNKKLLSLLKNPHTYIGFLGMAALILGYYFGREALNPGYLEMVSFNELGGRFEENLGSKNFSYWYHLEGFKNYRFAPWLLLALLALPLVYYSKNDKLRKLTTLSALAVLVHFFVISSSATKQPWYDLPMYPFLAMLAAIPLWILYSALQKVNLNSFALSGKIIAFLLLVVAFRAPYQEVWSNTFKPSEPPWNYETLGSEHFLFNVLYGKDNLDDAKVLHLGNNDHLRFYKKVLAQKGIEVELIAPEDLKSGDVVVSCQVEIHSLMNEEYSFELLNDSPLYSKYRILGLKQKTQQLEFAKS